MRMIPLHIHLPVSFLLALHSLLMLETYRLHTLPVQLYAQMHSVVVWLRLMRTQLLLLLLLLGGVNTCLSFFLLWILFRDRYSWWKESNVRRSVFIIGFFPGCFNCCNIRIKLLIGCVVDFGSATHVTIEHKYFINAWRRFMTVVYCCPLSLCCCCCCFCCVFGPHMCDISFRKIFALRVYTVEKTLDSQKPCPWALIIWSKNWALIKWFYR